MPAVYCSDYFAREIAAELNGLSDSVFNYTKAYGDQGLPYFSKWICPNLNDTTILDDASIKVSVTTCDDAKSYDPTFEPDLTCIDSSEIEE